MFGCPYSENSVPSRPMPIISRSVYSWLRKLHADQCYATHCVIPKVLIPTGMTLVSESRTTGGLQFFCFRMP